MTLCADIFAVSILCLSLADALLTNETLHEEDTLPKLSADETCVPGKSYKKDCNICFCNSNNALLCTKMACLDSDIEKNKLTSPNDGHFVLRQGKPRNTELSELPTGPCVRGKIYLKGCQKCFCDDQKQAHCTNKKDACKDLTQKSLRMHSPEDVRPPFKPSELNFVPTLPNQAAKCEPGKTYKVECNMCLCLANMNLMCGKTLCLSFDDMHRIEAEKITGTPCISNETRSSDCITCVCVRGKMSCEPIPGCISESDRRRQSMGQENLKLSFKRNIRKCVLDTVYKDDCNKCYCQSGGHLRCTLKTCLNYRQVVLLKKQQQYLLKHGL